MNALYASDTSTNDTQDIVKDVGLATFKKDVLEASAAAIVLVVFWTPRDLTGPKLISAVEKYVRANKGTIKLAKIDIDRDAVIAQQMGIQSVPAIYAFYKGRPIDAFSGAMSDAHIKAWGDQLLKLSGASADERSGFDTALRQADDFLSNGDFSTARSIYTDILDMDPENALAYAGLARSLLNEGDTKKAEEMINAAPETIAKHAAMDSLRAAIELHAQTLQCHADMAGLEAALADNPDDHQARFDLAMAHFASGQNEQATELLLEIVRRDRKWNDAAARKQLLKFFDAFGADDPLTISARKRLSSILFS